METVGFRTGEFPEITNVPPHEPEYQFQLAPVPRLPPIIPRVVDKPSQIGLKPETEVEGVDNVLITIVTLTHEVVLQSPEART